MFNSNKQTPHDAKQQIVDGKNILSTLQPVLQNVYSNKALLFLSKSVDWIEEFFYYLLALGCFVFIFIMNSISNDNDINSFNLAVKGLVLLVGVLFILLGLKKRVIRRSKSLLQAAGLELKKVEQYFTEKVNSLSKLSSETSSESETLTSTDQ
jgi:hypothetical protein